MILHLIGKRIDTDNLPILFAPTVSAEALEPGRTYHVTAGSAEGHCLSGTKDDRD